MPLAGTNLLVYSSSRESIEITSINFTYLNENTFHHNKWLIQKPNFYSNIASLNYNKNHCDLFCSLKFNKIKNTSHTIYLFAVLFV